jgi:hypothetical protein
MLIQSLLIFLVILIISNILLGVINKISPPCSSTSEFLTNLKNNKNKISKELSTVVLKNNKLVKLENSNSLDDLNSNSLDSNSLNLNNKKVKKNAELMNAINKHFPTIVEDNSDRSTKVTNLGTVVDYDITTKDISIVTKQKAIGKYNKELSHNSEREGYTDL